MCEPAAEGDHADFEARVAQEAILHLRVLSLRERHDGGQRQDASGTMYSADPLFRRSSLDWRMPGEGSYKGTKMSLLVASNPTRSRVSLHSQSYLAGDHVRPDVEAIRSYAI